MEGQSLFEYDYTIKSGEKFYLKDIIDEKTYTQLFKNKFVSFLNKGECGNGGTTGFINYALSHNRGCLILVPNRSIVISKEQDYEDNKNVSCVYGGCSSIDNEAKIVIATYDQFPFLLKNLSPGGFTRTDDIWKNEFWSGRTIIIDEYQKIVDDSGYRDICHKITELVKETNNGVVLMSATPHQGYIDLIRKVVKNREVVTYNVLYEQAVPKYIQVYDAKEKDLKSILKKVKECPSNKHTCVFLNSIQGIKKIIDHIGDCDCEILCSATNKEELGKYYSAAFSETKRLHFLTSAYFTGHDIKTPIRQCIIIGSKETKNMCLGERDIQQMIGRFRSGVDGIHIFYLHKKININDYQPIKDEYDRNTQFLNVMGEKWDSTPATIELKQETLRLEDTLERYNYWSSKDRLTKRLQRYGYVVKNKKIGEFDQVEKRVKLSFKEAKQKIAEGADISYDDNKYCYAIREYMKEKGVDEMLNASRTMITDWYKIRKNIGIINLEILSPEDKFKVLGLENFGRYKASYLMACLKYLGVPCEYDQIPEKMRETMECYATRYKADPKGKNTGDVYILFLRKDIWGIPPKSGMCLYIEEEKNIPEKRGIPHKISYQTTIKGKHCYGQTITLSDAPSRFKSMKGISLYDWVNEDKEHRLPEVKKGVCWSNIKKYHQTTISEMYKDSEQEYRHCKASMEYIDCLIVDIDCGISFDTFKQRYQDYAWVSYPTINNISEDWTKFRVIVPLKERLRISGEYSLMTLKMLRSMFCCYEDPNHQIGSYVNLEDWSLSKKNNGTLFEIPQEIVDNITTCIRNSRNMEALKFDKVQTDNNWKGYHRSSKTLQWAQDYFTSSFVLADGERHKRLFIIKNNLNDTDRNLFQSWLLSNYGMHYLTHWQSHKVIQVGK